MSEYDTLYDFAWWIAIISLCSIGGMLGYACYRIAKPTKAELDLELQDGDSVSTK